MMIVICLAAAVIVGLVFQTFYVKHSYHSLGSMPHRSNSKFTVVQLSDLHGRTRFLNGSLSKMVNKIQPDYVVITGDLASKKKQLVRVLDELQKIECRNIYFVPGNYEREEVYKFRKRSFSADEYAHIIQLIQKQGITVLENNGALRDINNKQLFIYGFDNSIYGNERISVSRAGLQHYDYVIFLAHSPTIIDTVDRKQLPYNLLLVGHTHGGQIRLFGRTIGAYKDCHVGLKIVEGGKSFYINRGLGTVKIPLRFACPPEIAVFQIG
ncbi:metallophosphoesterase [Paenibacillus eucommiae]|uniref:MPP superfamily phosphohydrolase n=1 Tax=Paenibacillus eucommiae TaxID=1355755 RepID=A0ABS4J704_9BACL|nr:metallophosphoesterase [Paenibacillus eucommiae]MBP1994886.1 putative MPP superfamily phosphohydrolase [Paenibacillus eucommiae]